MSSVEKSLCDPQTFSLVFKEYFDTLYKFLYFKCGNGAQAEDLTQEAFSRLWKNCSQVAFDTAKGYVFKTANNLLLNIYEHQKVKLKFIQKPHKDRSLEDGQYLLEEEELRTQIENAISALPEKQRVAFLLSRIEKKTYKEIASILGISKQAVEKRIYNALDTLRKICENIR